MKRRMLNLGLLMLLGAIVNVAVAWGCATWVMQGKGHQASLLSSDLTAIVRTSDGIREWSTSQFDNGVYMIERRTVAPLDVAHENYSTITVEYKVTQYRATSRSERIVAAGWPLRGLIAKPVRWQPVSNSSIIELLTEMHNPAWPGFAVNTIFYAAVLWVKCFAPFALRRRLRARRGLCPACAYPIGSSPVCTECGEAVQPSTFELT